MKHSDTYRLTAIVGGIYLLALLCFCWAVGYLSAEARLQQAHELRRNKQRIDTLRCKAAQADSLAKMLNHPTR